jgi:hypothetical protein
VTLRALLDASGRTPPDIAAAIGIGAARALAQVHADEGREGQLVPGALDAARIGLSDAGEVLLSAAGGDPDGDLRALGAALHECLAGEPPGAPPSRLDIPGVPAALAAVVDRATGAAPAGYASAAALAEAIADAVAAPATPAEVAAYVDAIVLPEEGERAAVPGPAASPTPAASPEPAGLGAPRSPDSVRTFPLPAPARPPSRLLPVIVAAVALAVGFGIGFLAQRTHAPQAPQPAPAEPSER